MKVLESMTRIISGDYTVRIWRNEPLEGIVNTVALKEKAAEVVGGWYNGNTWLLANSIAEIDPEIAAVEVVDRSGCGSLIYPDWK